MPIFRFSRLIILVLMVTGVIEFSAKAETKSPGLQIRKVMPESISPGESLPVYVIISNASSDALESVVVTGNLPSGYLLQKSDPECRTDGINLTWSLGRLDQGATRTLKLMLAPKPGAQAAGELKCDFKATHQPLAREAAQKVQRPTTTTGPIESEPTIRPAQFTEQPGKPTQLPERLPLPSEKLPAPTPPDNGPSIGNLARQEVGSQPDLPLPKLDPKVPVVPNVPKLPELPLLPPPMKGPEPKEFEPEDGEVLLASARNSVRAGNYADAIARFNRFIAKNPTNLQVREEYAGVLALSGQFGPAIQEYHHLLPLQPKNTLKLRIALADLYVQVKEYKLAIPQLLLARNELDQKAVGAMKQYIDITVRLVRSYLFNEQWKPALDEYEASLRKVLPGDPNQSSLFALMLVDFDLPAEAVAVVTKLKEPDATSPQAYVALARAYSRLGDMTKGMEAVQSLASKHPQELAVRRQLAEILSDSQDFDLAELAFVSIIQSQPDNVATQIAYARMLAKLFRISQATQILSTIRPDEKNLRAYRIARAECHAASGEYSEAREMMRQLTRIWPGDYEVRLALASLCESIGEHHKAKAELAKIPPDSWAGRQARVRTAAILVQEKKVPEALKIYEGLAYEYPHDGETIAGFSFAMVKAGLAERAEALVRSYIANSARALTHRSAGEAALGRVLLEMGRPRDAIAAYEAAINRPGPKDPYVVFGLAMSFLRSGMADQASETFRLATSSPLSSLRARLIFADRYLEEGEDARAAELAASSLHNEPFNAAAMIRMAEAKQRMANQSGQIQDAVKAADGILAGSPSNTRGLLIMARTLSLGKDYEGSAAAYCRLIQNDPDLAIAKRELARTYYAGREYSKAHMSYLSAQSVPDEQFKADLSMIARASPRAHDVLTALIASQAPGAIISPEVRKLSASLDDPYEKQILMSSALDFDARLAEAKAAGIEDVAKTNKDMRNWCAIPSYLDLIALEPSNIEAHFDLGQIYGAQKLNNKELEAYTKALTLDNHHRESQVASGRSAMELAPRVTGQTGYTKEDGRDGLTKVSTFRSSFLVEFPYDNENEVVGFGFTRVNYRPFNAVTLQGNILTMTGSTKVTDQYLAFGVLNYEQYESRIKDRVTFDAGSRFIGDQVSGEIAGFLENVPVNTEAINRGIYRGGLRIALERRETRRWDYGGLYRYAGYSDDNYMHEANLHTGFTLHYLPHQLRATGAIDLMSFSQQTILGPFPAPRVDGSIFPYFSPKLFAMYRGGVEYTHSLSRDNFVHSNSASLTSSYQLGWDNDFNAYHMLAAGVNYDVGSWMTLRGETRATFSRVYDYFSFNVWFHLRMPFRTD